MAMERQKAAPHRLTPSEQAVVIETIGCCAAKSDWIVEAASIESTHTDLLLTYTTRNIDDTVKWLKDQVTKAIHRTTPYNGPVWCQGKWRSFIYEEEVWEDTRQYIDRHNIRRGLGPRPYEFLP